MSIENEPSGEEEYAAALEAIAGLNLKDGQVAQHLFDLATMLQPRGNQEAINLLMQAARKFEQNIPGSQTIN